jgi:homoaconitase/3-isopropylmalate dehydratase large subunit
MEERITLCNMVIKSGGKNGVLMQLDINTLRYIITTIWMPVVEPLHYFFWKLPEIF